MDEITIPVTVLTVSFNAEATIARTIESIIAQTYENIEYIVIDGASRDSTAMIARSYVERFNAVPGRSMRVISEPDKGMYDALNKGARMASGVIVGQINADDWYEPDAVKTMAELYEREKYNVGWGTVRLHTGKGKIIKHAKLPKWLWTTMGWHHTTQFTEKEVLLQHPYVCENTSDEFPGDDWEFLTWCYVNGKKFSVTDEIITNFSFGGMSTKKSLKDVMKRLKSLYAPYKKYGLSKFYWFHRLCYEMLKYIMA